MDAQAPGRGTGAAVEDEVEPGAAQVREQIGELAARRPQIDRALEGSARSGLQTRAWPSLEEGGQRSGGSSRAQSAGNDGDRAAPRAGKVMVAAAMAASPGPARRTARRAGWRLRARPSRRWRASLGLKPSLSQPPDLEGVLGLRRRAACAIDVGETDIGSQLVGLRVKSGRSMLASSERRRSGMPSRIRGSGSELIVICAVTGSRKIAARTTMLPRSKGPATAGAMKARESGAPL